MVLATQLGWPEEEIQIVEQGGILHDIGKIGVSDKILLKGDELTEAEWKSMKAHPRIGAEMIKGIEFLRPVLPYVLFHHERWDGSGYPFQLKGQDIPIEGRLLAVCDAFDAMTTKRPYRHGVEPEQAIEEIHRNRDIQFDSKVVDAFVSAWRNGHIQKVLKEQMPRQIPFRPHERHGPVTLPQEHRILQQSRS